MTTQLYPRTACALRTSPSKSIASRLTWLVISLLSWLHCGAFADNSAAHLTDRLSDRLLEYRAIYQGRYFGFNVEFERRLKKLDANQWQLSHNFSNLFIKIHEQSNFVTTDKSISANRYQYIRKGIGKNHRLDIHFDHVKGVALIERDEKKKQYKIDPNVIDKLNYQVALRQALLADPQLTSFSAKIADRSSVKRYLVVFDAKETLSTELGKVDTLRFRRDRKDKHGEVISSTIFWMVPDWQYLPARIQQIEKGKTYTLNIESLEVSNPPAKTPLAAFKS